MAELKIESVEDFEKWLEGKPKEVSAVLASRIALRVFPLVVDASFIENFDKTIVLPTLWASSLSWVAAKYPTHDKELDFAFASAASATARAAASATASASASAVSARAAVSAAAAASASASAASASASASAALWSMLTADCLWLESGGAVISTDQTAALAGHPLWADGAPKWAEKTWRDLTRVLLNEDKSWHVWINWYEARLRGEATITAPTDIVEKLDLDISIIDKEVWWEGPLAVNAEVQRLVDEALVEAREPEGDEVVVPDQGEGLTFALSANGKIAFAAGQPLADENGLEQIESLRDVLLEALDDFLNATVGTNGYANIRKDVEKYREVLSGELTDASIAQLYARGVRLDNAHLQLKAEIANGFAPETGGGVGEALDSILALHGPTILSSKKGKELLALSREYNHSRTEDLTYKEHAKAFSATLIKSSNFVEEDVAETINDLNNDIGEGPHPERSSDNARRANTNLLSRAARYVLENYGKELLLASSLGMSAVGAGAAFIDSILTFFLHNHQLISLLAIHGGQELSWLQNFLNWLKNRSEK